MSWFPRQLLDDKEKDKRWVEQNIEGIVRYYAFNTRFTAEKKKDQENYLLFNGILDPNMFTYVTDMWGLTNPARLVHYPLMNNAIDYLVGIYSASPLDYSVTVLNKEYVSRKLEKKVNLVMEKLFRSFYDEMGSSLGREVMMEEKVDIPIPENVDLFIEKMNVKEKLEDVTFIGLKKLEKEQSLHNVFKRGLYDYLITGKEFYSIGLMGDRIRIRRVDPRALIWDMNLETDDLTKTDWVGEERYLTMNEILDEFDEVAANKDHVQWLERIRQSTGDQFAKWNSPITWYFYDENAPLRIRVISTRWRSIKKVRVKISENVYDESTPFVKILPDDYKPRKGEKIELRYFPEVWEGTRIGHKLVVGAKRKSNQWRYGEGYKYVPLGYVGVIRNNINGISRSLVDYIKNINILYDIVMYHIELQLSRAGGKAVQYDMAFKPDKMSTADIMYHLKNSGLLFFNSRQEGLQIGGNPVPLRDVDLTLSQSITQLVNLKIVLEETLHRMTGISRQAMGQIAASDAVGTTKMSIEQSTIIGYSFMYDHVRVIEMVLNEAANLMKMAWKDKDSIAHVFGDTKYKFLQIDEEDVKQMRLSDFGIFVNNFVKESVKKETMMQLAQIALQGNPMFLKEIVKIVNADNSVQAEKILEQGLDAMQKLQIQMKQQELELGKMREETERMKLQVPLEVERMKQEGAIAKEQVKDGLQQDKERMKMEGKQDMETHRRRGDLDKIMLQARNEELVREEEGRKVAGEKKKGDKGGKILTPAPKGT